MMLEKIRAYRSTVPSASARCQSPESQNRCRLDGNDQPHPPAGPLERHEDASPGSARHSRHPATDAEDHARGRRDPHRRNGGIVQSNEAPRRPDRMDDGERDRLHRALESETAQEQDNAAAAADQTAAMAKADDGNEQRDNECQLDLAHRERGIEGRTFIRIEEEDDVRHGDEAGGHGDDRRQQACCHQDRAEQEPQDSQESAARLSVRIIEHEARRHYESCPPGRSRFASARRPSRDVIASLYQTPTAALPFRKA